MNAASILWVHLLVRCIVASSKHSQLLTQLATQADEVTYSSLIQQYSSV
jgi:hypothetical protein